MKPLIVDLDRIPEGGETLAIRLETTDVESWLRAGRHTGVSASAPLEAEVRLLPSGSDLFFLGQFATRLRYQCVRCLESFEAVLENTFHAVFARDEGVGSGEVELRSEELEVEVLPGGRLDATAALAEQFHLAVEPYRVCREECPGLCPACGASGGGTQCDCGADSPDPRFAALAHWQGRDADSGDD